MSGTFETFTAPPPAPPRNSAADADARPLRPETVPRLARLARRFVK
ncbi:hypothetical protein CTP10_R55800 [Cupriavidus sp. P-10]|nr:MULTISPECIES: hypothetical protein [unclassified Cupriavidus]BDB28169.1 hypothetical protein CTP10_R55800 [Cupriavidus sp. P-10]